MTDPIDRRALMGLAAAASLVPLSGSAMAATPPAGLTVIATIVARPDQADGLRMALAQLAASARDEAGCLGYTLYEDARAAGHFYTYEQWSGDAALDAHLASPAMAAAAARFGAMLAAAPVIARLRAL